MRRVGLGHRPTLAALRSVGPVRVRSLTRGSTATLRASVADRPWTRLVGLLVRQGRAIHTCFMRLAIDVVFVDRHGAVLDVVPECPPWRLGPVVWQRLDRRPRLVAHRPLGRARAREGLRLGQSARFRRSESVSDGATGRTPSIARRTTLAVSRARAVAVSSAASRHGRRAAWRSNGEA
jgi:uncharacterized membrane protein (UPF0127 family)